MRVIAGEAKGFRLKGPPGPGTRPMADKIKGALFSMLASLGVAPERVLDLYAGTGSLGIEALSRGADWADFVEQNAAAAAVVRANLVHTKFAEPGAGPPAVGRSPSCNRRAGATGGPAYDLVILDPPYADPAIVPTLSGSATRRWYNPARSSAIGHSPRVALPEQAGRLRRLRARCHGDSCFSIYEVDAADADHGGRRRCGSLRAAVR